MEKRLIEVWVGIRFMVRDGTETGRKMSLDPEDKKVKICR